MVAEDKKAQSRDFLRMYACVKSLCIPAQDLLTVLA